MDEAADEVSVLSRPAGNERRATLACATPLARGPRASLVKGVLPGMPVHRGSSLCPSSLHAITSSSRASSASRCALRAAFQRDRARRPGRALRRETCTLN